MRNALNYNIINGIRSKLKKNHPCPAKHAICNKENTIIHLEKCLVHLRARRRNTNAISLPNSDGTALFCDGSLWDWVAVWDWVLSIRLAGSWGGSKGRLGLGGLWWHCLRGMVWPFQPGGACCMASQLYGPGKVMRVRLDQRVLRCSSSGECCQSGEKRSRQAASLQGLFGETYF